MKKLLVAIAAVALLAAPAAAGDFADDILGMAMVDVDVVTLTDTEKSAVGGSIQHSWADYEGIEASANGFSLSYARRMSPDFVIGVGYGADTDLNNQAVKLTGKYTLSREDFATLK